MRNKSGEKGFTLVELAIVMVIIGLLVGTVLKGQAMIDDARIKRVINDINGISAAYFTYLDRYNAIPGDDSNANARWTNVADGGGNGLIGGTETTPTGESLEAWQALRYAGLISGNPAATGATVLPRHPYGNGIGLGDLAFTGIGTKNRILIVSIPAETAEIIDIKFDDGIFNSGTVQSTAAYAADTTVDLSYAL
ncbi:MAG: prepilin-type N-terminal cleavage/methylation domain-containing protein [Nitrospirota bacterium]